MTALFLAVALSAQIPDAVAQFFAASDAVRAKFIARYEHNLEVVARRSKEMKKGGINKTISAVRTQRVRDRKSPGGFGTKYTFPSQADKRKALEEIEQLRSDLTRHIDAMRDKTAWPVPELKSIKPGGVGLLDSAVVVQQVAGPQDMLAEFRDELVWISGVSTAGMVDDKAYFVREGEKKVLLRVAGTRSYTTVLGATKTIVELRPLKSAEIAPHVPDGQPLFLVPWIPVLQ